MSSCKFCCALPHLSHVTRKPVFGIFGRVSQNWSALLQRLPVLGIWDLANIDTRQRTTDWYALFCKHMTIKQVFSWCGSIEPQHNKTNKMTCVPSKDSDQPGHPPSLISLHSVHEETLGPYYPLSAQQRHWSDWLDAGCAGRIGGFLMTWLNYKWCWSIKESWCHMTNQTTFTCFVIMPWRRNIHQCLKLLEWPSVLHRNKSLKFRHLKKWLITLKFEQSGFTVE